MKNRIELENLIIKNKEHQDYIISGNLTVYGDVELENCSLIVYGIITFRGENAKISIINGDIYAEDLNSYSPIFIRKGDIRVKFLDLNKFESSPSNIDTDGKIKVTQNSWVGDVSCRTYIVYGNNFSHKINATEEVLILGTNNSYSIIAPNVHFGEYSSSNGCGITARTLKHLITIIRRLFKFIIFYFKK